MPQAFLQFVLIHIAFFVHSSSDAQYAHESFISAQADAASVQSVIFPSIMVPVLSVAVVVVERVVLHGATVVPASFNVHPQVPHDFWQLGFIQNGLVSQFPLAAHIGHCVLSLSAHPEAVPVVVAGAAVTAVPGAAVTTATGAPVVTAAVPHPHDISQYRVMYGAFLVHSPAPAQNPQNSFLSVHPAAGAAVTVFAVAGEPATAGQPLLVVLEAQVAAVSTVHPQLPHDF
jgi:hypothetical protein